MSLASDLVADRPAPAAAVRPRTVAIVGATGAVGAELIDQLERRAFPVKALRLLASPRSAGRSLTFRGQPVTVEALREGAFEGVDIAFFSAGASVSRQWAPVAAAAGALVVDNSSAFRMDPAAALVVPEANGAALEGHRGIFANPNCVAAIAVMALGPLQQLSALRRVTMATYQAASGAGAAAMEELKAETAACLEGRPFERKVLPHPYAFNVFSHNTDVDPATGYNSEETKVIQELRRILGAPDLNVGVTCIRVPVLRAHGMAITVETDTPILPEAARAALAGAPGVRLVDDRAGNHFPMPCEASGRDEVLVGRIRRDLGDPSGRSLALFVVGDQLLKGAALNAIQIAERLLDR
ncbi:MAG TPA: aspartate-semialdehyde dehydrogenase [Caulobacteraceae bacterium]|nr:aspartate-semialdehyde dehydrogenase [Caulobacteraceae bacterium]